VPRMMQCSALGKPSFPPSDQDNLLTAPVLWLRLIREPRVQTRNTAGDGEEMVRVVDCGPITPPSVQQAVLLYDGFAALATFVHEAEQPTLACGFLVDREQLIKGARAVALARLVFRSA